MIELNQQHPEAKSYRADGVLDVVDIFYTIQGEGPLAGEPAVFVRLAGCNLQCPGCDTNYTSPRAPIPVVSLRNEVMRVTEEARGGTTSQFRYPWDLSPRVVPSTVVITGGEPFRQNLGPAVRELLNKGWLVQIETNGTLYHEDFPWAGAVLVVCSPKTGTVHPELQRYVKHLKYVVADGNIGADGLPQRGVLGSATSIARPWKGFRGTVWVQPEDSGDPELNKANQKAAVSVCLQHGYKLCLQTHKIVGLP